MPDITPPASAGTLDGKILNGPGAPGRDYGTWTDADGRPVPLRMKGRPRGRFGSVPGWVPSWMVGWQGLVFYPFAASAWWIGYAELGWLWLAGAGLAFAAVAVGQVVALVYVLRQRPARARRQTFRAIAATMWVWSATSTLLMLVFSWLVLPGQLTGPAVVLRITMMIVVVGGLIDLRVALAYRCWRPW
jgi:hypothetical protein